MKTAYLALGGVAVMLAAVAIARTVLWSWQKRPELTMADWRARAWGGEPVRYKRTQSANRWKLRIGRGRDHARQKRA